MTTGLDVICPGCRKSFHVTTGAYSPHRPANGSMVRLKNPWRKWGWCSFGDAGNGLPPEIAERPDTYYSMMDCPGCGAPLAPNGKLTIREPEPEPEFVCSVCGKACKSALGLNSHMRSHE